jgi:prepilin-type N-terminal cleavage/methylation domain-containing protein
MQRLTQERGFTIIESMIAVAILLGGALATLAMLDTASHRTRSAADRQKATALAREVVEVAKSIPYRDVATETIVDRLRQDAGIAGDPGSPWRVERDGTVFTMNAETCWLDEPADGLGSKAAGGFCDGSSASGTADSHPIDLKQVTVSASWRNGSGSGSVRQSTLITSRGGSDAPAVQSIRITSPPDPLIASSAVTAARFAVATVADAEAVIWSVDGSQQGSAIGAARDWGFTWLLPDEDGTYDVSAQSVEESGLVGEPRSVTVVLNRFLPAAPADFTAGRNGEVVEAEWSASGERDVVGYRVYRQTSGSPSIVCELTTETSCVDTAPPVVHGNGTLDYWVVAVERVGTVDREGHSSPRVDVTGTNRPPETPHALTLAKDAQGDTVLTWQAAATPDRDAGDFVEMYRIYRDGTGVSNRVATVGGTETVWTDVETNGTAHQYWVTAVDSHLAESSPLGPVSG